MNILSLFDGISCGMVALERAGIKVDNYYASEIDKFAIKISKSNYPDIIQLGDINDIDFAKFIGKVDIIIGGSPCTDLSIAKANRKGLKGEHSNLFYKFVEALRVIKPRYFLLENVASMPMKDKDEISQLLCVEPILINSALLSAQQRNRLYWCNWINNQPDDRGITLKDILEDEVDNIYFQSNAKDKYILKNVRYNNDKAVTLTANNYKGFAADGTTKIPLPFNINPSGKGLGGVVNGIFQKSRTLTAGHENGIEIFKPIRVGDIMNGGQAGRVYSVIGKTISLSANGGGSGAKTGLYKIYLPDGDYIIRKLTPTECERLQTLPDGYTEGVSDTQRYKMLGNGWTVDVIHICLRG